jgi:hypothetical protein
MTSDEIVTCAAAMDEAARARVNAAMIQARATCEAITVVECPRPGMMHVRPLTMREKAAASTAACELAIIAEGGLRVLGRV